MNNDILLEIDTNDLTQDVINNIIGLYLLIPQLKHN